MPNKFIYLLIFYQKMNVDTSENKTFIETSNQGVGEVPWQVFNNCSI